MVNDLSNSYDGQRLLQHVNLELKQGEILGLLGSSGAGKTTLLRLIAGLEQGDTGAIFFDGTNLEGIAPHKRGFGMMFQDFALFPHKNVEQNIAFGLQTQKNTPDSVKKQVGRMLELVGLEGFEKRKVTDLSGGEQQRIALARSLAPGPRLLLLDEPLGSLDRSLRDRLAVDIREILKAVGVTAVFVTHDQLEAFSIADKIGILLDGVLSQVDSPEQIYQHPKNRKVAEFLGFNNILSGQIDWRQQSFHSQGLTIPVIPNIVNNDSSQVVVPQSKQNETIHLLLRPEGARLLDKSSLPQQAKSPSLAGTVVSKTYLGSTYRVLCQIEEHRLSFELPIHPVLPAVGEPIDLQLSPSSLTLLFE